MSFEPNRGQTTAHADYLARGPGYSVFLSRTSAVFAFSHHSLPASSNKQGNPRSHVDPEAIQNTPNQTSASESKPEVLEMQLAGVRAGIKAEGKDVLPGTANYFRGNDPAQWHTGIPTYKKVRYAGVYPGVDLIYYGNHSRLEYDFVVAPRANAGRIRLHFGGAKKVTLDGNGNLIVQMEDGSVSFHKPVVYQDSEDRRQQIEGAFVLSARNTVGFQLGAYDHAKPLVIDPILTYSTVAGGLSSGLTAMALDSAGEVVITGWSYDNFPTTPGALQTTSNFFADQSLYVAKLSADGSTLLYSTYLQGSTAGVNSNAIAVDSAGNAYVGGFTAETDFPTTPGAFMPANTSGTIKGFLTKINSTGTALIYSTYIGGSTHTDPVNGDLPQDTVTAVAVDAAGHAYISGCTHSLDFPVTPGVFQSQLATGNVDGNAFAAELNESGSALLYSTYLGGNSYDQAVSMAVDSAGNAVVGGVTTSTNFPVTAGAIVSTYKTGGANTGFVTKVNPTGAGLVFSTYLGGSTSEYLAGVTVDSAGSVYATGTTLSKDFPVTAGAFQPTFTGSFEAFITKFKPDGTALEYSTFLGGGLENSGIAVAVDSLGDAFVTGDTLSVDFPLTHGAFETVPYSMEVSAEDEPFLTELNPTGSALLYSSFIGGSGDFSAESEDLAVAIALDTSGNAYLAGSAVSADFPTTPGAFQTKLVGDIGVEPGQFEGEGAYVMKFNGKELNSTIPLSTTNLSVSATTQLPLESVMVTAQVLPSAGGAVPTGLIGFDLDYYNWSTATLDSTGSATYTTPANLMYIGEHAITALYLGDANNAPSAGSATVTSAFVPTTMTLTATPNPAQFGATVTFNIAVTSTPPTPVPTGLVSIAGAGFTVSPATLDSTGHATLTSSQLPVGADSLLAGYSPNDNLHASSSASVVVTISAPPAPPGPTFAPPAGSYSTAQNVAISDSTSGVAIYYTTDGTTPTVSSTLYTGPISVPQTVQIKAFALAGNTTSGPVASATYIVAGSPTFTISGTPVTVAPGASTSNTSTVTLTPTGGFSGVVALTASVSSSPAGASDPPFVSFGSSTSVFVNGVSSATATLLVITTGPSNAELRRPMRSGFPWSAAGSAVLACVLLMGIPTRSRRWRRLLGLLGLLATFAGGVSACGGGSSGGGGGGTGNPGTTPGNYIVTVTGTSGPTVATGTLTLTVQ